LRELFGFIRADEAISSAFRNANKSSPDRS
jgi:hypothetical protein